MAFCKKCGAEIPDGANVCPACGEPVKASGLDAVQNAAQNVAQNIINTPDSTSEFDSADIEKNKVISLLSYICILFIVPLLASPDSKYARFHANQGLVLFICEVVLDVAIGILAAIFGSISFLGTIFGIIGGLAGLLELAYMILGIVNAVTGKAKELPLIGKIRILK